MAIDLSGYVKCELRFTHEEWQDFQRWLLAGANGFRSEIYMVMNGQPFQLSDHRLRLGIAMLDKKMELARAMRNNRVANYLTCEFKMSDAAYTMFRMRF